MSALLDLLTAAGHEYRRVSAADGGEWAGPCPGCGGRDRFRVWPDKPHDGHSIAPPGRFWCRQCGANGDAIDYLRTFEGLSFAAACERLGIARPGREAAPAYRPAPVIADPRDWRPREYEPPTEAWREQAEALLAKAQARLAGDADAQDWLTMRGITPRAAKLYGIGYHVASSGGDGYASREAWGLPLEQRNGKPKRLWLPRGWVIPARDAEGRLMQLRIRRRPEDCKRFAQGVKYLPVEGSSQATMILHPEAPAFAVVESGFDAILLAALTGGRVGAICAWSAAARPDARAHALLSTCLCVLLALDYDPAGDKESAWWLARYRHALRLPRLAAKDPGDAAACGADLYAWLRDGMPRGVAMRLGMVGRNQCGVRSVESGVDRLADTAPAPPSTLHPPHSTAKRLTLNGREIWLTADRAEWAELARQGRAVFSPGELERLRPVLSGMGDAERERAVSGIIDAKEVLGGYIREARA